MNLKLRRLVRTPYSEQFALYVLDEKGEGVTVGKLDLHLTGDGLFGTLLLWDERLHEWADGNLDAFLQGLVEDLLEPRGMPAAYAVECFVPSLKTYRFYTNMQEDA